MSTPKPTTSAAVKAAADRAERTSKGEPEPDTLPEELDPAIAAEGLGMFAGESPVAAPSSPIASPSGSVKPKRKSPVEFSMGVVTELCNRLATRDADSGNLRSLRDICAMDDMPSEAAFRAWRSEYPAVKALYARAREERAHLIADAILEVANDDTLKPDDKRVRIDAYKWWASRVNKRDYGDRMEVAGDPENPIRTELSMTESARRLAFMLRSAAERMEASQAMQVAGQVIEAQPEPPAP